MKIFRVKFKAHHKAPWTYWLTGGDSESMEEAEQQLANLQTIRAQFGKKPALAFISIEEK